MKTFKITISFPGFPSQNFTQYNGMSPDEAIIYLHSIYKGMSQCQGIGGIYWNTEAQDEFTVETTSNTIDKIYKIEEEQ